MTKGKPPNQEPTIFALRKCCWRGSTYLILSWSKMIYTLKHLFFRVTTPIPDNGGIFYQGGCRVHGTSIILPDDESGQLLGPTTSNGGHRGHQGPDTPALSSARRRSPPSVSSSPLASPIPPLGPAPPYDHSNCSDRMHKSCACVSFIAEHTKAREEATKVRYFTSLLQS